MEDQQIATVSNFPIKFDTLKPICCDVMKMPSVETLLQLNRTLDRLPPKSFTPEILNYISFPLVVHLKAINRLQTKVKLSLLQTLAKVLAINGVDSFQCFFEIFQSYSIILGTKDGRATTDFNSSLPEDIVKYIEEGMARLLQNSLMFHSKALYDTKRVQSVGHCIYMQLQIISSDQPLNTRLRAIDAIDSLFSICAGNEEMCHAVFNFLPGVVIALRKSSSTRVGRVRKSLVVKSVMLLKKCVTISISFETLDKLTTVDQNLSGLFRSLSNELVCSDDDELRSAILNLSIDTIAESESKIPKCEEILWTNILIECWDQNGSLSTKSRLFLQENLHKTKLCDFEQLMINLKNSQTHFLSNNLDESITSLKCVASSLCVKKLLFIELSTILPPLSNLLTIAIMKHQLDLDKEIDSTLFKRNPFLVVCDNVCKSLREAVNFDDLCEEIVPFLTFNSTLPFSERVENGFVGVLFLFNKLLSSFLPAEGVEEKDGFSYDFQNCDLMNISSLFLEVLDLQLTDRVQANPKTLTSLEYESVLLIEGLGTLASLDPQCVLPIVLYYLLEHAGDQESILISNAAKNALLNISKFSSFHTGLELQSLKEFLSQNLDLIMSELSVRISAISSHPKCPNALIFLANHFDFSQTEFVTLIEQGFTQSCDYFYATSQKTFTKLFYAFIYSLWNQRKDKLNFQIKNMTNSHKKESLSVKLLNYQQALGVKVESASNLKSHSQELLDECDRILDGEHETMDNDLRQQPFENKLENESMEVENPELVPELKLVLKICQRVLNFVPSHEDRTIQLTAMDCLIMGVQLLQNFDDALLPLAHTIWPNLANRFTENDLVIVQKSFELLLALCRTSGSFLRKRVVQQVFPKLTSLLVSLASESERVEQRHVLYYTHTQAYKLQMIILQGLADLSLSIELSEEELDQIVSGCLLYTKPQQHKNLREAAMKVIETFANSDQGGIIWMKLIAVGLRDAPMEPPDPQYTPCPQFKI